MKNAVRVMILPALAALASATAAAGESAAVDAQAPAFTLRDASGVSHSLADYRGKYVILEWVNFTCPFVGKHYGSGSMMYMSGVVFAP